MINLDEVVINRYGTSVSVVELQADVNAAIKKGFHPENDFAFSSATVQGLIDLVIQLSCKNERTKESIIIRNSDFTGQYSNYFNQIANGIPTYMALPMFNNIDNDPILTHNFLIALRLVKPTRNLQFTRKSINFISTLASLNTNEGVTIDQINNIDNKNTICIHPVIWLAYIAYKIESVDDDIRNNFIQLEQNTKTLQIQNLLTRARNILFDLKD